MQAAGAHALGASFRTSFRNSSWKRAATLGPRTQVTPVIRVHVSNKQTGKPSK